MFEVTSVWKSTYPEAHAGVLVMRALSNPTHHPELESRKVALEEQSRAQFSGQDRGTIASHPILRALQGNNKLFFANIPNIDDFFCTA